MKAEVIGIVSPKGGVGKTTLASNIGISLVKYYKKKVLAIDANVHTANLSMYLGMYSTPSTLNDLVRSKYPLTQALYVHNSGLRVIPASIGIESKKHPLSVKSLKKLLDQVRSQYDYIILDSPPGLHKDVRTIIKGSDRVLLVVTPDVPTVMTTMKALPLAKKLEKGKKLQVIVNKATGHGNELTKKEIQESFGVPVIGEIYHDMHIISSVSKQTPLMVEHGLTRTSTRKIIEISGRICGEKPPHLPVSSGFLAGLRERFGKRKDARAITQLENLRTNK